ncbi:MAG: aminopeptidase N [Actinomycetota bacterium]|nr:aminopeptidase N [Actinomycetota bacterium]
MEERNNLTRDEARARASLISDPDYRVDLDLAASDEHYRSEVVVRFACSEPGASTFLDLIADEVESVELNGAAIDAPYDGARIALRNLAGENEVHVVARCRFSHTGVGLHRFTDPVDDRVYAYTDFEPFDAHRVYACFDQPDLKGVFRFSVRAPQGWEVVSNMAAAADPTPDDGAMRWEFRPTPRMSTYITCVVAGPYHAVRDRHGEIDLGIYCRQSMARHLDPDEIFEITKQGFDFFEQSFQYPYVFGKYDQVMVPEFNSGAMENAGVITFNESYIFRSKVTDASRERRAETILHEMAHMWFGDLVTMRWWDDLWLNESFASFVSVLAMVKATRFTNAWTTFANSEKTWAYHQDQLPTTHPITADMPDTLSIRNNFDGITYAKGASVLRQLVAWVGEDEFLAGLVAYFRRHEFGNTDLSDFLAALEETSGRDLHAWAKEWLQTAGLNTLRASFETRVEDDQEVFDSFAVLQEAPAEWPNLRPHRLAIGLYDRTDDGLVRRRRVELDVAGSSTAVPELAGERVPDLVLVNDDDLAYTRIRLDPRSLATVTTGLGELQDSLARVLCWGAAWDMVREAELPTRDFTTLVLGAIHAEDDIGVVQRVLAQLSFAIDVYGDPQNRDAARQALAETALEALRGAEPGSDFQLAWARTFASAASTADHLAVVASLLEETEVVQGLAIDTELRWHFIGALSAAGKATDQAIAAELERDPTDQGRRHAAAALAARPTERAKREAWDAVVGDPSLSIATMSALMRGFQQPRQVELLLPYVGPYFEALGPTWESRSLEVALAFAGGMYPTFVVSEDVVARTDRYLEESQPPGPIRRTVVEGRDGVARALRARARDIAARS